FFDCPGGRFWVWPFLEYRIIKDLAHLDKIARECIPLRWRLWFYKQYTGRKYLNKADRGRLQKIARYYAGR
ncbi:MAG TPA: heptose kinase, partial [Pseudomonadales bacterium]|nr:heptose kinase [Pseudomonadales bacterium]